MHTPSPQPRGPRRSSSRPLDVAASVVLTVGLLGSAAPAAQAAEAASAPFAKTAVDDSTSASAAMPQSSPAAGAPASSVADEHPSLKSSVTAKFKDQPPFTDGQRVFKVTYTIHLTNTGDVPLTVPANGGLPFRVSGPVTIAVGESKDFDADDIVLEDELVGGSWRYVGTVAAYTPKGVRIVSDIDTLIPVPGYVPPQPSPAPSQPATPTPAPSTSAPAPAPLPVPTVATQEITVTVTGKFLTEPGELVKEGTRVEFSQDVKNTGVVDITNVLGHEKLAVGESFHLMTTEAVVTAQNLEDGFVTPEVESASEILPGGTRVIVSAPKLPIPDKAPVSTEKPDLDVKVSGTFQVKAGEPVVAGTKVKWVAALTNTGDTALRDVQVADSEKLAELPVGKTGEVSFESTVSERDVLEHSVSVAAAATAITRDGYDYSKQTLGTLAIPAVAPAPAGPDTPASAGPVSPAPAGHDAQPSSAAAARSVTEVATSSSRGEAGTSSAAGATRSTAGHLASTGSDAAAMLPAAGVLALLGAVGVFLGRRRRSRTATE